MADFDEILGLDEALVRKGYVEGMRVGGVQGEAEGLQLGRGKGAEMAVRVAMYKGRLDAFQMLLARHPAAFPKRASIAIEQTEEAISQAQRELHDPQAQAGFDALDTVETKLRLIGSLLKLSQRPTDETQTLDF